MAAPAPTPRRPPLALAAGWVARLAAIVVAALAAGLLLPLVGPLDRALFAAVNEAGYPPAAYDLLDPHERIYRGLVLVAAAAALVRGPWHALGAAVATMLAAVLSYGALEAVAQLVDRARPEEVLERVAQPPGRTWLQASYPSGHAAVTAGMATAAMRAVPPLRAPMWVAIVVIGWSRVAFGAHFPLDVVVAVGLGYAAGLLAADVARGVGLLPRWRPARRSTTTVSETSTG